jgi:hypothetical protein
VAPRFPLGRSFLPRSLLAVRAAHIARNRCTSLTRHELDSLVGFLSFASRAIPASCPFLRRLYDAQGTRNPRPHRLSLGTRPSKERSSATSSMERHTPPRRTGYPQPSATQAIELSNTGHTPIKGAVKRDLKPSATQAIEQHSAHAHQRSGQARPQVEARVPTSMERHTPLRRTGYPQPSATQAIELSNTGHTPINGAVKRDLKPSATQAIEQHSVHAHQRSGQA